MQKSVMTIALVAGAGALGAAGLMSMQRMYGVDEPIRLIGGCKCRGRHGMRRVVGQVMGHNMGQDMGDSVSHMGRTVCHAADDFVDELCAMAHKTGNAMICTGRMINRIVP